MRTLTKDGHLYKEKAEDMTVQVALSENPRQWPSIEGKRVGIIYTSMADLPEDFYAAYPDGKVSFVITIDSDSYKDKQPEEKHTRGDQETPPTLEYRFIIERSVITWSLEPWRSVRRTFGISR